MASIIKADTLQSTTANVFILNSSGTEYARFDATGVFQLVNPTTFPAGTAALPSITATGDTNTGIFFPAADTIAFSEGGVEAMRIDSSGRLILGDTTADGRLKVVETAAGAGVTFYNSVNNSAGQIGTTNEAGTANSLEINAYRGSGRIVFKTNNTYAASIDSSGNLLLGATTSTYGKLEVKINTSGNVGAARFINDASSGYAGELVQMISSQAASTAYNILSCYYSGGAAYAFKVRGDGVLFAQNTTVQSASDLRFKQNITNATDGLNVVTALRPVRYDLIEGNGVTGKTNQLGFIAQEVKTVFPDAVDVWGESDDPENPYLSLGTGSLIPVLVKAIQEQQALITALTATTTSQTEAITALTARIAALESTP